MDVCLHLAQCITFVKIVLLQFSCGIFCKLVDEGTVRQSLMEHISLMFVFIFYVHASDALYYLCCVMFPGFDGTEDKQKQAA